MKILRTLLAASVVLASVGCQSDKYASRTVAPSPVVASSKIYYSYDENFRTYFGPEGVAAMERWLREALPQSEEIQVISSEPDK